MDQHQLGIFLGDISNPPLGIGGHQGDLQGGRKRLVDASQVKRFSSHLQQLLLAARGGGYLVLGGVTDVPFGALPVHLGSRLPLDHSVKYGISPCRSKRQAGRLTNWGAVKGYFIDVLIYDIFSTLGISAVYSKDGARIRSP